MPIVIRSDGAEFSAPRNALTGIKVGKATVALAAARNRRRLIGIFGEEVFIKTKL